MTEAHWTWMLFAMEIIGVYGSYTVGNKRWYGHMIVALHSIPWAIYSIVFDKPGFMAMWVLWQWVHWRNMVVWLKDGKKEKTLNQH
jgi:hypothetical protein